METEVRAPGLVDDERNPVRVGDLGVSRDVRERGFRQSASEFSLA